VCKIELLNWHTRRIFGPYISLLRSIQSDVLVLFPLLSSVRIECIQVQGDFGHAVSCLGKTVTCESYFVTVKVTLQRVYPYSEVV